MPRLQGKIAIVTGGAQGIGEEIASRLVQEGARVAIADLNGDKAKTVAAGLNRNGANAIGIAVDVANRAQVRAAVEETVKAFGRLDIFFNNAGFNKPLPFMDVDENNFNSIMRVNAWGVLVCTQEAARQMMAQGGAARLSTPLRLPGVRATRSSRRIARARRRSFRSRKRPRANSPNTRSQSTPLRPAWW